MTTRMRLICLSGVLATIPLAAYGQHTWHVDVDACPDEGTGTRADPLCSIQSAINRSSAGDTVSVAPGIYTENIDYLGKSIAIISTNGSGETTIRNAADHRVVRFSNSEGRGAVLDGFTITGASGGIGCGPNSEPTIRRCRMEFNFAATGPGIDCFEANPLIVNCEFFNNEATLYNGGAILCNRSSPVIANCLIKGNGAMIGGGGIYCYDNASPTIVNCNLYLNGAKWGGGVFADNNSHPTLANCIVWLNYPGALVVGVDSSITATYSSIQSTPVYPGIGNIAESPHFHTSGDFRLVPGSPGIDAGDNSAVPVEALLDLDGLPRLADDTFTDDTGAGTAPIVDMGVYEYRDCDEDGDPDPLKFGDCSVSPKWCDCNQNGLLDECDIDDGRANDCNLNDVPDVCEGPGDFDADGDVDLINFAFFRSCQTPPIASQLFGSCCFFDFDVDLDVDLRNFAQFQNGFDPS